MEYNINNNQQYSQRNDCNIFDSSADPYGSYSLSNEDLNMMQSPKKQYKAYKTQRDKHYHKN